jgi:hypothetical protein
MVRTRGLPIGLAATAELTCFFLVHFEPRTSFGILHHKLIVSIIDDST